MGVVRWLNTVFLQLLLQRMCSQYVSEKKKCFPMEIYYAFVAFDISHLSARSSVHHTYKGSDVRAFVLLNLEDNATHSLKFEEIWQKSNSRGS